MTTNVRFFWEAEPFRTLMNKDRGLALTKGANFVERMYNVSEVGARVINRARDAAIFEGMGGDVNNPYDRGEQHGSFALWNSVFTAGLIDNNGPGIGYSDVRR